MFTFFLVLLVIDALVLGVAVLLQSGKGGGLAASFGGTSSSMDSFLGGRQAATLLHKVSWVAGGVFLVLAVTLSVLSTRSRAPSSVLEGEFQEATPQPVAPSPLLPATPLEGGSQGAQGGQGTAPGQTPPAQEVPGQRQEGAGRNR